MKIPRDQKIDHLRALAIVCIILAHTGVQGIIFNVRCFDVPLMAFCLGISYFYSSKNIPYLAYCKKRFRRLLVPTYLFLIVLFVTFFSLDTLTNSPVHFQPDYILRAFFLDTGYGYAWIMRTFFFVSLVMPFLYKLSQKVTTFSGILGLFSLLLAVQVFFIYLAKILPETYQFIFVQLVPLAFGYCPIAFIGLLVSKMTVKQLIQLTIATFCYFITSFYVLGLHGLTFYKYPPQLPFILYGCFCVLCLWLLLIKYKGSFLTPITNYLSLHSQELYFIHIFYVYIYEFYLSQAGNLLNNWFINFLYLLTMSLASLFLLNKGKQWMRTKNLNFSMKNRLG